MSLQLVFTFLHLQVRQRQRNGEQAGAGVEEHRASAAGGKRRSGSGSEKESGGKIFFTAGLAAVVAVAYFVWQVKSELASLRFKYPLCRATLRPGSTQLWTIQRW